MINRNHFKKLLGWLVQRSQPATPVLTEVEMAAEREQRARDLVTYMKTQGVSKFSYDGLSVEFNPISDSAKPVMNIDDKQEQMRFLRETAEELVKDENTNMMWSV